MIEQLQLKRIIEGALLAAGEPLNMDRLMALFGSADQPEKAQIREVLKQIAEDYQGRGFELKEVASGWRFQVCQDVGEWVGRLWEEKPARYSRALLETLSLIAYRQPVTRGEIEEVRGVSVSSNIIRTLLEREWVRVVGHRDVPGKPAMYATTKAFLDYFNLKNLNELPTLAEIRDLDKLTPELEFEVAVDAEAQAETDSDQADADTERGAEIADQQESVSQTINEENDGNEGENKDAPGIVAHEEPLATQEAVLVEPSHP